MWKKELKRSVALNLLTIEKRVLVIHSVQFSPILQETLFSMISIVFCLKEICQKFEENQIAGNTRFLNIC